MSTGKLPCCVLVFWFFSLILISFIVGFLHRLGFVAMIMSIRKKDLVSKMNGVANFINLNSLG